MLDETTLERRLVILEQAVSDLQRKVDSKPAPENWLQKLIGSISDEAAFLEVLEYGRTFRQTDKPIDENDEQS
ncbi:transferase hexapeptide repeat containing protein [Desertifilum sp. FACHB-1129]|uniref:Transferase hexapeptide repeat containing protein n=2 Tax=Desertifilum tharense IPPAS B-1220 TaxID=1781255 RepID=A0A1E5QME8_9CYAN|nr:MULTISPECIES: transferase hexapeptide repeat containing protein [Desertifilum]MDA0210480.1 transferase hexapeptide repeat containing protein [Cyanobacteria bacterium FC1]MBD2311480.1 transferase hexapeptide repeat containing protein [Desertifilum sp. FACHB-1129]MBD2323054.1 transferase hexapeptide repeat containing protein [Desertifilum sp. FACHB-866]MBD2332899.1 transferase hexapeptide repeat containing protein [Desertifilum sp. FACHB-868]OEJ75757.1 transferase hexapeptide repeat containin